MKPLKSTAALLFTLIMSSCLTATRGYSDLDAHTLDAGDAQSILIHADHGELEIVGADTGQVVVSGQAFFADDVDTQTENADGQININIQDQHGGVVENSVRLKILVPNQMQVKVETESASVHVQGYHGEVEASSTSGNMVVENTIGSVTLRSNRGNITVRETSGRIGVVGNYGSLSLQDCHGEASVSTIMGTVLFEGVIINGDRVELETDHGPVEVNLLSDSSLEIIVRSTSGDVACVIPNLSSTPRSCEGQVGNGDGSLNIRTVSGSVTARLLP